jgi:hypothetical protein
MSPFSFLPNCRILKEEGEEAKNAEKAEATKAKKAEALE